MQTGDYIVKPDCVQDENELIEFLKSNDFTYNHDFEDNSLNRDYLIVVNVIYRSYFMIDKFYIAEKPMPPEEFYRKIRYHPKERIEYKKLYSDECDLLYEGYTVNNKPYGLGTLYFANGNKYQEGIFYIKGLSEGKEYYPNGQVKFEGVWNTTRGYGPNAPRKGNFYGTDGKLIFSGEFEIKRGGVGYPMIKYPKNYRNVEKERPKIEYVGSNDL